MFAYVVGLLWKLCFVSFNHQVPEWPSLIWQQIKIQMSSYIQKGFVSCFKWHCNTQHSDDIYRGLTMQAKQVTCTSVKSFKPQGNNVLFYGYIREMAPSQTKLSIFNVPVCVGGWERERKREKLPPSFLDELSMLWSNQYAGSRFEVGMTVSSLQTHELHSQAPNFTACSLFPQVLLGGTWICILILIEKSYKSTNKN